MGGYRRDDWFNGPVEYWRLELLREADAYKSDAVRQEAALRAMTVAQEDFWMGPRAGRVAELRGRAASLLAAAAAIP